MSLFEPAETPCPGCGVIMSFDLSASVNADRRPDLRQEILADTFQCVPCGSCGVLVRLPPALTYMDVGRGQWILVKPASALGEWTDLERIARETFDLSFGSGASRPARQIGQRLCPRIVFGWPALREKLLVVEEGVDDVVLELLKLAVLRNITGAPLNDASELRLVDVTDGVLTLAWLLAETGDELSTLELQREALDEIAADAEGWAALRQRLTAALFVDVGRLMLADA
jgi:hypothetical protein